MNVQVKKRLIYFLCSTQTVLMLRDLIFDDYKYRIKQVNQTAAPVFFILNLHVKLFIGSFSDSWEGNWAPTHRNRKKIWTEAGVRLILPRFLTDRLL